MKKVTSSETTYTFYGPGGMLCEFSTSTALSNATAAASTDKTLYRTSERTGTAVLLFTTAGVVIENNRTLPYGEPWLADVASANDKKFTTYDRDKESGLDYAMARMYANTGGRFTSPDQGQVHPRVPSTLNRYVYGGLDPINHIDPSGLDWFDEWFGMAMYGDAATYASAGYCSYDLFRQTYSSLCPGYSDPVAESMADWAWRLQNTYDAIAANADYHAGVCSLQDCLSRNPTLTAGCPIGDLECALETAGFAGEGWLRPDRFGKPTLTGDFSNPRNANDIVSGGNFRCRNGSGMHPEIQGPGARDCRQMDETGNGSLQVVLNREGQFYADIDLFDAYDIPLGTLLHVGVEVISPRFMDWLRR